MRISDWSSDVCSSDLILCRSQPDLLIGARLGSPLVVGVGEGETYLGSDALALASLTPRVIYPEEGDWVVCGHDKIQIYDQAHQRVDRAITQSGVDGALISKGNHRHYTNQEVN